MLIEFCIFRFDNQNGYICGSVDWFIFYWITSSKVENFPHLSSAREIHRHHCRPPALPDRRSAVAQPPSCSSISKTINHSKPHVDPLFYLRSVELYMQGYILLLCQICQDFFLVSKWNKSALWMNDYNCSLLRKIFWRKLSCLLNWFFSFWSISVKYACINLSSKGMCVSVKIVPVLHFSVCDIVSISSVFRQYFQLLEWSFGF